MLRYSFYYEIVYLSLQIQRRYWPMTERGSQLGRKRILDCLPAGWLCDYVRWAAGECMKFGICSYIAIISIILSYYHSLNTHRTFTLLVYEPEVR